MKVKFPLTLLKKIGVVVIIWSEKESDVKMNILFFESQKAIEKEGVDVLKNEVVLACHHSFGG